MTVPSNAPRGQWLSGLCKEFPAAAPQLCALDTHLFAKHQLLNELVRFCAARPDLSVVKMYVEYSVALDEVMLETAPTPRISSKLLSAQARWQKTHEKIIAIAVELILAQAPWTVNTLLVRAEISIGTFYNHFATKNRVVAAAYEVLLAQ